MQSTSLPQDKELAPDCKSVYHFLLKKRLTILKKKKKKELTTVKNMVSNIVNLKSGSVFFFFLVSHCNRQQKNPQTKNSMDYALSLVWSVVRE